MTHRIVFQWTHDRNGNRSIYTIEAETREQLKQRLADLIRDLIDNGWAQPKWWQFWRLYDTKPPLRNLELHPDLRGDQASLSEDAGKKTPKLPAEEASKTGNT